MTTVTSRADAIDPIMMKNQLATAVFAGFDRSAIEPWNRRGNDKFESHGKRPHRGRADLNSYGCLNASRHGWPNHISRVASVPSLVSRRLPAGLMIV